MLLYQEINCAGNTLLASAGHSLGLGTGWVRCTGSQGFCEPPSWVRRSEQEAGWPWSPPPGSSPAGNGEE